MLSTVDVCSIRLVENSGMLFPIIQNLSQIGIHYCLFLIGEDDLLDVLEEIMPVAGSCKAICWRDSGMHILILVDPSLFAAKDYMEVALWLCQSPNTLPGLHPTQCSDCMIVVLYALAVHTNYTGTPRCTQ